MSSAPVFSGVRVTRSLALYVCSVDCCLSFCPFSFGHCVVCPSSSYGFWLSLLYHQTLLIPPLSRSLWLFQRKFNPSPKRSLWLFQSRLIPPLGRYLWLFQRKFNPSPRRSLWLFQSKLIPPPSRSLWLFQSTLIPPPSQSLWLFQVFYRSWLYIWVTRWGPCCSVFLLCLSSSCVPLLPVSLDCPFRLPLRYSLTFIYFIRAEKASPSVVWKGIFLPVPVFLFLFIAIRSTWIKYQEIVTCIIDE